MKACEAAMPVVVESGDEEEEEVEVREGGKGEELRWEKLLPRMPVRVLLVEADDSTRQIIAALLRKCNYRGLLLFYFGSFADYLSCK